MAKGRTTLVSSRTSPASSRETPSPPQDQAAGTTKRKRLPKPVDVYSAQCLECVKACVYLEHFKEYPGRCIRKVTKNITSLPGKSYRTETPFINACSLCGLCGAVCPTDLDMGFVNREARKIMWSKRIMPPAIHHFAIADMDASNTGPEAIARNQPATTRAPTFSFRGANCPPRLRATLSACTCISPTGYGAESG